MLKKNKNIFWFIAILFITLLWIFQNKITVNIPWWDDFHGIILPVFHQFTDISFWEKIKIFFSLNNEHRVVNDRIFLLIIYLITGTFQLKTLALLGFINLIVIFLVLVRVAKPLVNNPLYLLPIVFLIFQAQYYESLQSLMVPFQNFSVTLYVFSTLYFLIFRKDKSIVLAIILATLAILSHGNGILALLIGAIILLFNGRYKQLLIWVLASVFIIGMYFWGYEKPDWNSGVSPTQHPFEALKYVFEFFGAYILNITDLSTRVSSGFLKHLISQIFGLILVGTFLLVFLKKYPIFSKDWKVAITRLKHSKSDQFFIALFGFIFATGLMIGISRTGFPMLSRYTINSAFMVITVYMFLISNIEKRKSLAILTSFFSLIILILSYFNNYDIAIFKKNNAITDGINYQKTGSWINQYSDSTHVMKLNPLLIAPLKAKKYFFNKNILDNYVNLDTNIPSEKCEFQIVSNYLEITFKGNFDAKNDSDGIYYTLENENFKFIFPAYNSKNTVKDFIKSGKYFSDSYRTAFPTNILPIGEYNIYQIVKNGSELKKFDLDKTFGSNAIIK